jgi:hypothetical protein
MDINDIKILKSKNVEDYEILLRKRGVYEYASYCPQLNYMIKGKEHNETLEAMKLYIQNHIDSIADEQNEISDEADIPRNETSIDDIELIGNNIDSGDEIEADDSILDTETFDNESEQNDIEVDGEYN